jgi:type IV secretory pathway VirB6-like protein
MNAGLFATLSATRVANLQQVLTTVLAAEHTVLLPILKALLIIFIGRQFFLVMFGHLMMERFWGSVIRALIIVFLVANTTNFSTWVATKVFTNIPAALTSMGVGSFAPTNAGQTSAQQFDTMAAAGNALRSQIIAEIQITVPETWINAISAATGDMAFQIILSLLFGIWMLGLGLIAITLCLGPPFLCFELFDRTRGFVDQWIAKIVGFAAFGFATSIVLAMEMQSLQTLTQAAMEWHRRASPPPLALTSTSSAARYSTCC